MSTMMDHVNVSSSLNHSPSSTSIKYKFHSSNNPSSKNGITPSNTQQFIFNFKSSTPNIMSSSPIVGIQKKKKVHSNDKFRYYSPTITTCTTSVVSPNSPSSPQKLNETIPNSKVATKGNSTSGSKTRECLFYVQTCQTDTRGKLVVKRNREPSSMNGQRKSPPSETLLNANLPNVNFVASPSSSFDNQSLQTKQSPTVATTTVSTPFSYIPDNTNKTFKVDHRNQQGTTSNITTTQPRSFPITQQNQLLPSINELLNQSATFMTSASCHHFNYNGNRAILPCVHDLVSHGFQFSQSSSIFTL